MRKLMCLLPIVLLLCSGFTCHNAAVTSRGAAASLVALQESEITLHQAGKVTDSEHIQLQRGFIAISDAGQQVDKCIGNSGGAPCVDIATTAVSVVVNSPTVVGIKNPESKAAITLAAQALIASLTILKGAL